MKKEIKTSVIINAAPEKVWEVFSDFKAYPKWNPLIKSLTGDVKKGNTIRVEVLGMTFKPKVLSFRKMQGLKWLGKLYIKGLFDGEHSFYLENLKDGCVKFHHQEKFNGLLVGLLSKKMDRETKPGFIAMNEALKARAEKTQ